MMDVDDGAGDDPGPVPAEAEDSDDDKPLMPAVPPPPETDAARAERLIEASRDRLFAESRKHLMTHTPH